MKARASTGSLDMTKEAYQAFAHARTPRKNIFGNALRAFFVGGLICLVGQCVQTAYTSFFQFDQTSAGNPTVATLILCSTLLTGFGIYDRIGQWAGAGTAVPVTGFANSIASAAIEHRSEGVIIGVGTKMFKVAGPVIVFGVVSAFAVAIIRLVIVQLR